MKIPGHFVAGDTVTWNDHTITAPRGRLLPAGAWSLVYALRGPGLADATAVQDGSGWTTTLTADTTAALPVGEYVWQAYVAGEDGTRLTVGEGNTAVRANLATAAAGFDGRTTAQVALDAINAEIQARLTGHLTIEYTIAGRTLRKEAMSALLTLKDYYAAIRANEIRASRRRQGLADPTKRFIGFGSR